MTYNADDYVDVAQRIDEFKAKFPEGTLQSYVPPFVVEADGKAFVVYGAAAYRTPDDARPGVGWAWEPVPGPTAFTKNSELQNAETSAWGRAIVALGFKTKKIASADEVRNRADPAESQTPPKGKKNGVISDAQRKRLFTIASENNVTNHRMREIVKQIAGVDSTKEIPKDKYDEIVQAVEVEDIPFA